MNLINQKNFLTLNVMPITMVNLHEYQQKIFLGKMEYFSSFYPADFFSFVCPYGIRGYARALCAFTGIKL